MSGTKEGAIKARNTNLTKHGKDFYKHIGSKGGKWCGAKGFALDLERAKRAGRLGGKISKRGKAKKHEENKG